MVINPEHIYNAGKVVGSVSKAAAPLVDDAAEVAGDAARVTGSASKTPGLGGRIGNFFTWAFGGTGDDIAQIGAKSKSAASDAYDAGKIALGRTGKLAVGTGAVVTTAGVAVSVGDATGDAINNRFGIGTPNAASTPKGKVAKWFEETTGKKTEDLSGPGALLFGAIAAAVGALGFLSSAALGVPLMIGLGLLGAAGGAMFGGEAVTSLQKTAPAVTAPASTPAASKAAQPTTSTTMEIEPPLPTPPKPASTAGKGAQSAGHTP